MARKFLYKYKGRQPIIADISVDGNGDMPLAVRAGQIVRCFPISKWDIDLKLFSQTSLER